MIDEYNVREMLHRRANAVPTPVVDAPKATRRARRRLFANGAVAMLAVAAIALAGLAGVDEIRGAPVPADQPSPSVTPPQSPFPERFESPLNDLSIGYPSGWRTRAATEPWAHDTLAFDAPGVDVIFDPAFRDDLYIAVGSEPLSGKSPRDWVYDTLSANDYWTHQICQRGGGGGAGDPFQGNFAWFEECHEPHGAAASYVIFATATRGYMIYNHVADVRNRQAIYDAHWFEGGILGTVELPGDAPDSSNTSASS